MSSTPQFPALLSFLAGTYYQSIWGEFSTHRQIWDDYIRYESFSTQRLLLEEIETLLTYAHDEAFAVCESALKSNGFALNRETLQPFLVKVRDYIQAVLPSEKLAHIEAAFGAKFTFLREQSYQLPSLMEKMFLEPDGDYLVADILRCAQLDEETVLGIITEPVKGLVMGFLFPTQLKHAEEPLKRAFLMVDCRPDLNPANEEVQCFAISPLPHWPALMARGLYKLGEEATVQALEEMFGPLLDEPGKLACREAMPRELWPASWV